jgi:hypothetical protein
MAAPVHRHLTYVALGDSYTSAPLVLPHDTAFVPEDCGQSLFNYPHLARYAIGATRFTDVSCGSATIDDLYAPQHGLPLGSTNRAQMDAVGPEDDVISLGIGGNDVGFVGLALGCVRLAGPELDRPCSWANTAGGHDRTSERIAADGPKLGKALDDLHAKAPHALLLVVGYPDALPDDGRACWPYVPILQADMPYLVAKFKEMNAMLAHQAALHDATYVDLYDASIGHDACQPPGLAWVNAVVVVPPSYPAHPNMFGQADAAAVLATAVVQGLASR